MSANAIPLQSAIAAVVAPVVMPVVDYEPPAVGGPPVPPPATALRRRHTTVAPPARRPATAEDRRYAAATLAAATFADAALRRILEVIDRRRPSAQIRPLLAAGLADSLPAGAIGIGTARLRRVVAQIADTRGLAAEVAASYTRGDRVGAIACRAELLGTPTGPRWQLVALHIG